MSGSSREDLPDVRKQLPVDRDWSGGPPGYPGEVGRPFRMTGSGREALSDDREWSGGPSGCPGVVLSLTRMSGSGREALLDVREWS